MKGATSIHFEPCKIGCSERHNLREKSLDYVRQELTQYNESYCVRSDLNALYEEIKQQTKELTGRAMQAKATPIREAVAVLADHCTMTDLRGFATILEMKYNVKVLQIHIHEDEGHWNEGVWMKNRHAHLVCDFFDHTTGKTVKLNRQDMSEMQTDLARCLHMQRGESSSKKHLNAMQYKCAATEKELQETCEKLSSLVQSLDKFNLTMKRENIVYRAELEERERLQLTGEEAVQHYNQWMHDNGMDYLMVPRPTEPKFAQKKEQQKRSADRRSLGL